MTVQPYSKKINNYLAEDSIINFSDSSILETASTLYENSKNEIDFIKNAFEFVRDKISHSADINAIELPYVASDVLKAKHGICFAKSHLLAAILRVKSVPAGLCYQKLTFSVEGKSTLVYHGLNGVYIKELNKWIRLDARGNKQGINAQFLLDKEQLAYQIDESKGEVDNFTVYPAIDKNVLSKFTQNKNRTELWKNLPTQLEYERI